MEMSDLIYFDNSATEFVADNNKTWMNPNAKYAHKSNELLSDLSNKMHYLLNTHSGIVVFGGQNASQLIDLLMYKIKDVEFDVTKK